MRLKMHSASPLGQPTISKEANDTTDLVVPAKRSASLSFLQPDSVKKGRHEVETDKVY